MKYLITVLSCLLSVSAFADIDPLPANYIYTPGSTYSNNIEDVDATGQLSDDPDQSSTITSTEQATVSAAYATANTTIKLQRQKRLENAFKNRKK